MCPIKLEALAIVPVPKKGDLNLIKNYRPISLTEPLRKPMEHCLLKYVNLKVGPSFLTQGGFRTNHCCNDMVLVLHEAASKYQTKLHTAFLDIKAAYDSVDRRILWRRCCNRGPLLKLLTSWRKCLITMPVKLSLVENVHSPSTSNQVFSKDPSSARASTQSSLDDLAYELSNPAKVQVGSALINCTMYADDIALFATDPGTLQVLLANVKSTPAPTDTNSVLPNVK